VGQQVPDLPERQRLGSGLHGEAAQARRPRLVETGHAPDLDRAYVMPILHKASLFAVISLHSERDGAFSEGERHSLNLAAKLVALLANTLTHFRDSQQIINRFERFQMLAQGLSEQLNTGQLLQAIVEAARDMLDTQMSILLEVRVDDVQLYPVAWAGIEEDTALMLKSTLREDLKGMVAWARRPARTANLLTDQRTARATHARVAGMLSELAVPVIYHETLYGTLAVETDQHREFTDEEMNLLSSLAAQAGVALNNAQQFEAVQATNRELERVVSELRKSQEELALAHEAQLRAI